MLYKLLNLYLLHSCPRYSSPVHLFVHPTIITLLSFSLPFMVKQWLLSYAFVIHIFAYPQLAIRGISCLLVTTVEAVTCALTHPIIMTHSHCFLLLLHHAQYASCFTYFWWCFSMFRNTTQLMTGATYRWIFFKT